MWPTGRGAEEHGCLSALKFEDEAKYEDYVSSASFHAAHGKFLPSVTTGRSVAVYEAVVQIAFIVAFGVRLRTFVVRFLLVSVISHDTTSASPSGGLPCYATDGG